MVFHNDRFLARSLGVSHRLHSLDGDLDLLSRTKFEGAGVSCGRGALWRVLKVLGMLLPSAWPSDGNPQEDLPCAGRAP